MEIEEVSYKRKKKGSKSPSKKSKKKNNIWSEFGLKRPVYVRYSGYGGVLWYVLSQYVRQSEFKQYGGYCVDGCGRKVNDWHDADCGHFRSAVKLTTRFLRENLGLQTKFCNSPFMGNDNTYGFGKTINQRYGEGKAEEIIELSNKNGKQMTKDEYRAEIRRIQELLKQYEHPTP